MVEKIYNEFYMRNDFKEMLDLVVRLLNGLRILKREAASKLGSMALSFRRG